MMTPFGIFGVVTWQEFRVVTWQEIRLINGNDPLGKASALVRQQTWQDLRVPNSQEIRVDKW